MKIDRPILLTVLIGFAILGIGGALILAKVFSVAQTNTGFICAFGTALNASPVEQRAEQSDREFRRDVQTAREFVQSLNQLQDCNPPAVIRIQKNSRPALRPNRRTNEGASTNTSQPHRSAPSASQGGVSPTSAPAAPSQPAPSPSGGGGNTPPSNPPPSNPPANNPGLLDPVTDTVCELNPAGIRICL